MDFVIVGAGAVGVVVGTLLQAAGHRVHFWMRPGKKQTLPPLSIERIGHARIELTHPSVLSPGSSVPPSDWVLVCTRGEQLTAALSDVVQHMGPERRVAIAAVTLTNLGELARNAGLTGAVFALHASFGSHADPETPHHYRWFPFALPSTVTPDGQRQQRADARALGHTLTAAGLPTRSALSMATSMRFITAFNSVLALGWDLASWQLTRLAADDGLRRDTARALGETSAVLWPQRRISIRLPVWLLDLALRIAPHLMGAKGREVWLRHGPKIRPQTDAIVRELLARAPERTPALSGLHDRWRAQCLPS